MRLVRGIVASGVVCLGLVACQAGSPAGTDAGLTSSPQGTEASSGSPQAGDAQAVAALATEQLADQLDIDADQIVLVAVQPVDWRDASLGCPKPGVDYVRETTPGFTIRLRAQGEEHEFHADEGDRVVTC